MATVENDVIKVTVSNGSTRNVITVSPGVSALSSVSLSLNDLSNVDTSGISNGQTIVYENGNFVAGDAGAVKTVNDTNPDVDGNVDVSLSSLPDTSISNPVDNDFLKYANNRWVNDSIDISEVTGLQSSLDGKASTADVPQNLNDLSDVTIAGTPTGNQALIYDGSTGVFKSKPSYTNRFEDGVETAKNNIDTQSVFGERVYSVKSEGDGIFIDSQSDTPTSGNVIVRKIYHKSGFITSSDVLGDYTLIHTFADDTAYSSTVSVFDGFEEGATYGTPPYTLIQTWEEQTAAPAFTGLLNESYGSGAAAAYGTRRLNGNYTGACMTIRRASDGTTTTIGFDGEDIDEAAIETFCTGTTCTVQVWYDQSQSGGTGSGNDAEQTDSTKQPTIYTGGALVKDGGRLALDFDGSDDGYLLNTSGLDIGSLSSFTVGRFATTANQNMMLALSGNVNNKRWYAPYSTNGNINFGYASSGVAISTTLNTNQNVFTMIAGTTLNGVEAWVNSTSAGTATRTTGIDSTKTGLGNWNGSLYMDGTVQEVIYYSSDKSTDRTDIEGNISDYYQSAKLLNEQYGEGAAAAYSVRLLDRDYTGSAVQLERSSDNSYQNIGFDVNGDLDESAISTFCTGTTCKVRTWYDQSGNGNDAVQTNHANQPTIYTGGAIVKENGRVAVEFDGSDDQLTHNISGLTSGNFTFTDVFTSSDVAAILHSSTSTNTKWIMIAQTSTQIALSDGFLTTYATYFKNGSAAFSSTTTRTEFKNAFFNGNQNLAFYHGTTNSVPVSQMYLGRYQQSGFQFSGKLQESILWTSDQQTAGNRTSIESNIGDYFTQNTPLLDTYTGAAAAYSLRKLRSAYTGSAIEVYNGTSYQDIGFNVFGELDTVSLAAFCGANNGFVSKWYDQSGNTNDAAQTATGSMPKIYDGTTGVVTENGRPAVDFDGTDDFFESSTFSISDGSLAAVFVLRADSNGTYCHSQNGTVRGAYGVGDHFFIHVGTTPNTTRTNLGGPTGQALIGWRVNDGTTDLYENGTSVASETYTGSVTTGTTGLDLMQRSNNGSRINGTMQELIYYGTNKGSDMPNIQSAINDYYQIY